MFFNFKVRGVSNLILEIQLNFRPKLWLVATCPMRPYNYVLRRCSERLAQLSYFTLPKTIFISEIRSVEFDPIDSGPRNEVSTRRLQKMTNVAKLALSA